MDIDFGFSMKKAYLILKECREMRIYPILIFLVALFISGVFQLVSGEVQHILSGYMMDGVFFGDFSEVMDELLPYIGVMIIYALIGWILSTIITAAVIRSGYDHLRGKGSFRKSMYVALDRLLPLAGATVILFLLLLGISSLMLLILISPLFCIVILFVPFFLIYVLIRLMFYQYAIVIFRKGAIEGLKDSWEATSGRVLDVFVFGLIVGLITAPAGLLYSASPFPISLIFLFISALLNLWEVMAIMLVYLQLKGIYGKNGFAKSVVKTEYPESRAILLVGFTGDEVERIRSMGLPAYGISQDARMFVLREILLNPGNFEGDSTWTRGRYAIIHGFRGEEIGSVLRAISSSAEGEVNFTTTTPTSLEWTLNYVLKEMSRP